MTWRVEFAETARRQLRDIDKAMRERILRFLQERVVERGDPRSVGQALKGERFATLWRYRVGDHRVIVSIEDDRCVVLVVRIGHRREVYDR